MDIQKIIDKYGDQLSNSLQTTTNKLYPKLLWYVRVNGLVKIIQFVMFLGIMGMGSYFIHGLFKKYKIYNDPTLFIFLWITILFMLAIFAAVITSVLITAIVQIISPDYWIIQQVVKTV